MSNRRPAHFHCYLCLILLLTLYLGSVAACGGSDGESPGAQSPSASRSSATVKIMPLGDSITESSKGHNSYRYYLWHLLIDSGFHVDFVGSKHGVGGGPAADSDFDMDHEGHAGWRTDEILNHIQEWAAAASPDVVLLHIGTNDVCQRRSVASTVNNISGIIDALRTVNPHVRILLAELINSSNCPPGALNASVPALVADKNRQESPITLVDQFSGFDPATMTDDGTHPNAAGDSRMAARWFDQLAPVLDAFLAGER